MPLKCGRENVLLGANAACFAVGSIYTMNSGAEKGGLGSDIVTESLNKQNLKLPCEDFYYRRQPIPFCPELIRY